MKYHIKTTTHQQDCTGISLFTKMCDDLYIDEDFRTLDEIETLKTFCDGELTIENGIVTLVYDDSENSDTKTTLSFDEKKPKDITVKKEGFSSSVMLFSEGKRHICVYTTPYMPFEVSIFSKGVDNRLLSDGYLEITYIIEIKGAQAQKTIFRMEIKNDRDGI